MKHALINMYYFYLFIEVSTFSQFLLFFSLLGLLRHLPLSPNLSLFFFFFFFSPLGFLCLISIFLPISPLIFFLLFFSPLGSLCVSVAPSLSASLSQHLILSLSISNSQVSLLVSPSSFLSFPSRSHRCSNRGMSWRNRLEMDKSKTQRKDGRER
jgi:hypothetical protein